MPRLTRSTRDWHARAPRIAADALPGWAALESSGWQHACVAAKDAPTGRAREISCWNGARWAGMLVLMSDVTRILSQIESGDPAAAEQLLPLVYDELRRLAAAKLAHEKPGQTLQATALVHEAYVRLVDVEKAQQWDSRGHFFAAAADIDRKYERRMRAKNGGHQRTG